MAPIARFAAFAAAMASSPVFGGEGGIATEGDSLVSVSADGVDINVIWAEVAAVVKAWNAERSALTSLLAFNTTNTADAIPQSRSQDSFELASEFGELNRCDRRPIMR